MVKKKSSPSVGTPLHGIEKEFPINEIPWVNRYGVQPVYSSTVATMNSQFDIRLLFGEIVMEGINIPPQTILKANIVLTPAHAKALSEALANTISQYETTFGEIPWPPKVEKTKAN